MAKKGCLGLLHTGILLFGLLSVATALTLTSPAFKNTQTIPTIYTCYGRGLTPPLIWHQAPAGTRSFALIIDDPDAPHGRFTHWILFNLPGSLTALPDSDNIHSESVPGRNSKGEASYFPPCPPPRSGTHHYHFQLYALDRLLPLSYGAKKQQVMAAMSGHILAHATLVATVTRQ